MVPRSSVIGLLGTSALTLTFALATPAAAQSNGREAQIVVDAQTNEVLYENYARESRRPASITKVMTLYLLFDALKQGSLSWNDRIVFSRNAAAQPPTKLFVGAGNSISVQTAIEALVLRSANDVATAVAEALGGSEANFAQMMTAKARELGMANTTFRNASGLPNATQRSTAEDLARLAIAIHRDFPDQYHWFSAQEMTYNGQTITGHNHLMKRMPGMDGLKTGYTNASGFNLAATSERSGRRIVTVVLGGANRFQRDDLVEALTESAYRDLGIGATQFAMLPSAYQINFRDARDAADAAALVMDMPARTVTAGGAATMAMNRTGRRLTFERGAPSFQVADMTRPGVRWPSPSTITATTTRDGDDDVATDEGEEAAPVARPASTTRPTSTRVAQSVPTPVPVPFNVAVVTPTPTLTRVPVVFPQATAPAAPNAVPPASTPLATPLRQMASLEAQAPREQASTAAPIVVLPPVTRETRAPVVVFPETQTPLRGTQSAEVAPAPVSEAASVQAPAPLPAATTQMAAIEPPQATTETASTPPTSNGEVQVAALETPPASANNSEASPAQNDTAVTPNATTQLAQLARDDAAALGTVPTTERAPDAPQVLPQPAQSAVADLNGTINLADNQAATGGLIGDGVANAPSGENAPQTAPVQMAANDAMEAAIAAAQRRQEEATAREQALIAQTEAAEAARAQAARSAALAARAQAEREAAARRAAQRQLAEAAAKAQRDKEARELALAEREAVRERARAAAEEERRQAEVARARNARGTAIVQVGAFKDRGDASAALAQFERFFPQFCERGSYQRQPQRRRLVSRPFWRHRLDRRT